MGQEEVEKYRFTLQIAIESAEGDYKSAKRSLLQAADWMSDYLQGLRHVALQDRGYCGGHSTRTEKLLRAHARYEGTLNALTSLRKLMAEFEARFGPKEST